MTCCTVKRMGREYIGDAVTRVLGEVKPVKVIAIVPRMLQRFGQFPESYEVVEVDIIYERLEPVTGPDPRD